MNVFEKADERLWSLIEEKTNANDKEEVAKEFYALQQAHHTPVIIFLYDFLEELQKKKIPFAVNVHYFPKAVIKTIFRPKDSRAIEHDKPYDGKKLALFFDVEADRLGEVVALLRSRYKNIYRPAYYVEKLNRHIVSLGTYYLSDGEPNKPLIEVNGETCLLKDDDKTKLQNKDACKGFYFVIFPRKNILSTYGRIPDGRVYERELSYNILRGEYKIGENLIEIMGYDKRILLECGKAIFPDENTEKTERAVRKEAYDAVVISHVHEDHCGLLREPIAAKNIYMGECTFAILQEKNLICEENANKVEIMKSEEGFFVGEMRIVPHLCDHSAADSYMIEISDNVKTILYTGDFRSNGRKNFDALLTRLPDKVDVLISEKTLEVEKNETERELETKATQIMKNHKEIFILQSAENLDRIVSFYRACIRSDTDFLMTPLPASITSKFAKTPNPKTFSHCYLYLPRKVDEDKHEKLKEEYGNKFIGREQIAKTNRFAMMVSSGMLGYLKKLSELRDLSNAVFIYSLWEGYKEKDSMESFLSGIESLGIKIIGLHVSGHADNEARDKLIARTNPKQIKYVHTFEVAK